MSDCHSFALAVHLLTCGKQATPPLSHARHIAQFARGPAAACAPFVSVIVPVYNDAKALGSLLRALAEQDYAAGRFECLIIDNGSEPPLAITHELAFPVRVVREEQQGSYAARNRGLREARGEILAFTDADCAPRRDWLSSAVARIVAAGRPIILGGGLEVWRERETRDQALGWHSVVNDLDQARFLSEYHFAATANMITTREVFDRVGPFDPALYSGGDLEWGRRAWSLSIDQVYGSEVVVRHPARSDWRSLVEKTRRIAGGHFALHRQAGCPLTTTLGLTLRIATATLWRSWRDPRIPTARCRLQVMLIDLALRSIQLCEVLRLGLGGQPRRQ